MIYGNRFFPTSNKVVEEEVLSVAYNEYLNYSKLLEECTDEANKPILEAQVQVLCEVTFKDIWDKVISLIKWISGKVRELIGRIVAFFGKTFAKHGKEDIDKMNKELSPKFKVTRDKINEATDSSDDLGAIYSSIASDNRLYFYIEDFVKSDYYMNNLDGEIHEFMNTLEQENPNVASMEKLSNKIKSESLEAIFTPNFWFKYFDNKRSGGTNVDNLKKSVDEVIYAHPSIKDNDSKGICDRLEDILDKYSGELDKMRKTMDKLDKSFDNLLQSSSRMMGKKDINRHSIFFKPIIEDLSFIANLYKEYLAFCGIMESHLESTIAFASKSWNRLVTYFGTIKLKSA